MLVTKTLIIAIACISVIAGCEPEVTAPESWFAMGAPEWIVPVSGRHIQSISKSGGVVVCADGWPLYPVALVTASGVVKQVGPLEETPHCGAVSPDGKTVALLYDFSIAFYDVDRKIIVERIMSNLLPISYRHIGLTFGANGNDVYVYGHSYAYENASVTGAIRLRVDRSAWLVEALPGHATDRYSEFSAGILAPEPMLDKDHIRLSTSSCWIVSSGRMENVPRAVRLALPNEVYKGTVLDNAARGWWVFEESMAKRYDGDGKANRQLTYDRYIPSGFTSVGDLKLESCGDPQISKNDRYLAYLELVHNQELWKNSWSIVVWDLSSERIVKRLALESWLNSSQRYYDQPVTLCFDSNDDNILYSLSSGYVAKWRIR